MRIGTTFRDCLSFRRYTTRKMRSACLATTVSIRELSGTVDIKALTEMEFTIGKVQVRAMFVNHPGVCAGYSLLTSAGSIAFLPDHEPYDFLHSARGNQMSAEQAKKIGAEERASLIQFLHGSDI